MKILEELLENGKISEFAKRWINESGLDEDTIKRTYNLLKRMGVKDDKIATVAQLLTFKPETIKFNYQRLKKLGLTDDKIASQANLLAYNPKTIETNYQKLKSLGLKDDKIFFHVSLLEMNPETIKFNYQRLKKLGLTDDKIASQANLLTFNPKTIESNYQSLKKLGLTNDKIATLAQLLWRNPKTIKKNYQELRKYLSKKLICNQGQLLGINLNTTLSNIQYLHSIGINYEGNPLLLGTKTKTKRDKIKYLLTDVLGYKPESKNNGLIKKVYEIIKKEPGLLFYSIKTLEKKRDKLIKKYCE